MRISAGAALLAALLGVAACAPRATTASTGQDAARPASVGYGTIVSMRLVAGGHDVSTSILGAIGGVAGSAVQNQAGKGETVEFILHEDGGQTVSIVQTNEDNFRLGERVLMTHGARTRLARGTPPTPPST
jgi:outer membrane lipoprotein SlyB